MTAALALTAAYIIALAWPIRSRNTSTKEPTNGQ